jgi:hypothetical protein
MLFGIFPTWSGLWIVWRVLIAVGWLTIAVAAIWLSAVSDDELQERVAAGEDRAVLAEHRALLRDQLQSLLVPGVGGLPLQYQVTLYAPSPDGRFLIPLYPPALSLRDPAIFAVGAGAVGKAWEEPDEIFVVKGEAVSSAEHGLTAEQSRRYKRFHVVAALSVRDDEDHPIGVLTAIGRDDDGFFDTEAGAEVLDSLADTISWLMPEAIEWMMPRESEMP